MVMLYETTLLIAPGSAGKSSLTLALAAHLALGKDFGPHRTHVRGKSIIYNGEDDRAEQSRRLYAVCQAYGFDYNEVKQNIMLLTADDLDLKLVTAQGRAPIANEALIQQLIALASDPDVVLVAYDPLVDIHDVDESDNPQMNSVMKVMRRIAKQANVASVICHHTSKAGNAKQEDRIGNVEIGRGAGGIVYKVRIAFTLLNASATDAEEFGLQDSERQAWVRLDDAKQQYVLADHTPMWFHKEGVKLGNDVIGVLRYQPLTKDSTNIKMRVADILAMTMAGNGSGSMGIMQAVAVVKAQEPLWSNKTDVDVKRRLETMFNIAVEVKGRKVQVIRNGDGILVTLQ